MAKDNLVIIKKSYEFSKWLLNHSGKFPRSHRFSIAVKLENAMLEFVELVTVGGRSFGATGIGFQPGLHRIKAMHSKCNSPRTNWIAIPLWIASGACSAALAVAVLGPRESGFSSACIA